jgi:type IV secretory pathway VirB4 component
MAKQTEKQKKLQTTKDFVQIAEIRDSILVLKDGSLRSIVEVSSINFELKSADEQVAIIQGFQNFLNSVDFPLQIVVNSRKLDVGPYIKSLETLGGILKNELLKIQAAEYTRFVAGLTELTNIMAKKFYIVVPFHAVEAAAQTKAGLFGAIKSVVSPSKFIKALTEEEIENYKTQLGQRIGVIIEGLSGLGIETKTLAGDTLTNLFYSYYNPGQHL